MKKNIVEAWEHLNQIKFVYKMGGMTYEDAKSQCEPHLAVINARAKEIAKEFKKTHYPLTFTKIMR